MNNYKKGELVLKILKNLLKIRGHIMKKNDLTLTGYRKQYVERKSDNNLPSEFL